MPAQSAPLGVGSKNTVSRAQNSDRGPLYQDKRHARSTSSIASGGQKRDFTTRSAVSLPRLRGAVVDLPLALLNRLRSKSDWHFVVSSAA